MYFVDSWLDLQHCLIWNLTHQAKTQGWGSMSSSLSKAVLGECLQLSVSVLCGSLLTFNFFFFLNAQNVHNHQWKHITLNSKNVDLVAEQGGQSANF